MMAKLEHDPAAMHVASLNGRRSLVTGAASGIGLAIAREFGKLGAEVLAVDLPGTALESAVAQIKGAKAFATDLTSRPQLRELAATVGEVDILVNCAGIQHVSPVEGFDEGHWDALLAVMLTAPFLLIKSLIPGMYERDWGRIINIASVYGLIGTINKSAYIAAKHGLVGLTKAIALEAAARKRNVTVNALCPSAAKTPLAERQIADQARLTGLPPSEVLERVMLERNAIKRLVEPEAIATMIAFLCRDDMWAVTGRAVPMDAGVLAR